MNSQLALGRNATGGEASIGAPPPDRGYARCQLVTWAPPWATRWSLGYALCVDLYWSLLDKLLKRLPDRPLQLSVEQLVMQELADHSMDSGCADARDIVVKISWQCSRAFLVYVLVGHMPVSDSQVYTRIVLNSCWGSMLSNYER